MARLGRTALISGVCCFFAATSGMSGAQAQGPTVLQLFEKYNLIGTSALDCSKPVGQSNRYYVHRPLPPGQV